VKPYVLSSALALALLAAACCRTGLGDTDGDGEETSNAPSAAGSGGAARTGRSGRGRRPPTVRPNAAPTQVRPPRVTPTAPAATPAPPAAAGGFRIVPESEWRNQIGPRLKVGSLVASTVWEGSIGGSPRGLFTFYSLNNELHGILLAGGKSFHTPALSDTPFVTLAHVDGTELLDFDHDGKSEVLVMAQYESGAGQVRIPFPDNAVVSWTGAAFAKLPGPSKRVSDAKSFAEARQRLGLSAGPAD
jgi:hypothetical protein